VDSFNKGGRQGPDAHGFMAYISSDEMVNKYFNQLKFKSTKKRPLSFERLNLIVFPVFKYFESQVEGKNQQQYGDAVEKMQKALI